MKELLRSDFLDWRTNPVTEAVFKSIQERMERLTQLLSNQAGLDPSEDRRLTGMIAAYRTLLEIEFEEFDHE